MKSLFTFNNTNNIKTTKKILINKKDKSIVEKTEKREKPLYDNNILLSSIIKQNKLLKKQNEDIVKLYMFTKEKYNDLENKYNNLKSITNKLSNKLSNELSETKQNISKLIEDNTNKLFEKLNNIQKELYIIKQSNIYIEDNCIKELKKEKILFKDDFNLEYVLKIITYRDNRTILNIMKQYYKINEGTIKYPFKYKEKQGFDYFYNGKWIHDTYGEIIIDILFYNVKDLLLSCNLFDNVKSMSTFIENQIFIQKLNDKKYKKEFKKYLKNELLTNE